MKGYELLSKALNGQIKPKTIVSTEHKAGYFDDFKERDYYIFLNDNMFHRCNEEGKLGSKYQDRFLNYKVLEKNFEIVKILEKDKKIKHIDLFDYYTGYEYESIKELSKHLEMNFEELNTKINELIDELNKLKEKENER